MDIQSQIEDAIQSLFLEEYRGDLRQAYNNIVQYESRLDVNTDESDPEQKAYFLRSKVQVYMLVSCQYQSTSENSM